MDVPAGSEPVTRVAVLSTDELEVLVAEASARAAEQVLHASTTQRGLKVSEVAERLSCAESTVYGMIQRGEFPVIRLGSAIRVPESALDDWVRSQTAPLHQPRPPA
ncbi:helix-turn-helix domain-containing protein [Euzebya sp.]|uniref:helix-turn-helix domain-containing protein n=1 Tax=Euzebya sp. TaxID=1971409 RepID=UPI0035172286